MRTSETLRHLIGPVELIHEQAGPQLLRLTRIGVFVLWIFKLLLDPLWRLAEMPRELFQPVGILALLPDSTVDALLTPTGLILLLFATILACAVCLTDHAFPFTATIAAILLTAYSSLIRSFGPAVHTDIVLLLATYALAGFAWADWLGGRSRIRPTDAEKGNRIAPFVYAAEQLDKSARYPLITIVALLTLSYFMVGLNRAVSGGISVFTSDTMEIWAIDASLRGYYFNTNVGWHIPEWPAVVFMLRAGLPFITIFEITAPLCLAWPHYRWIFMPVMLSFHFMSLVFMNIFFFDDMLLYLLLIDWSRRFRALRA